MRRLLIVGLVMLVAACGSGGKTLDVDGESLVYVPMGNSITFTPSGTHESMFARYSAMLEEDFGVKVEVRQQTVGEETAAHFLERLRTDEGLRDDLARADVVTFLVPNDEWAEPLQTAVGAEGRDPASCGGDDGQQCLRDMIAAYKTSVDDIFAELTKLVDPTTSVVRAQDVYLFHTEILTQESFDLLYPYWKEGQDYVAQVADEYGIPLAHVFDAFMGTDGRKVDLVAEGLVSSDGLHPTSTGALVMAELTRDLGYGLAD